MGIETPKGIKFKTMIYTTSLKHYKELKQKGVSVTLVTKQDIKGLNTHTT